jgi:DNA polymerase-3 subunit epsilon
MNSKIIAFPARKPLRKVVLNTETTGLYPEEGHRIIELSAIELNGQEITQNRFHRYFNPEREVDEGATEVHGWTLEKLQDKPKFAEFANQIAEFIRDTELIVHNAQFDVSFLNSEFERVGLPPVESICKKVTDTLMIARELNPGEKNNLNALCERYEVDDSHLITHGALLDAELIAEVYLRMINGTKN